MIIFRTAGYILFYHAGNEEFFYEFKVGPFDEKLIGYKSNCLQHVKRLNYNRMPKMMLNCGPNERRRFGRPLKGLLDEAQTGLSRPNS
jgi:hypothetical protein